MFLLGGCCLAETKPHNDDLEDDGSSVLAQLAEDIPPRAFDVEILCPSKGGVAGDLTFTELEDGSEDEVEDVQRVPQRRLNRRRGAVSAEASGGFNVRYACRTLPVNTDISDLHIRLLVRSLGVVPFLRGESHQTLEMLARAMHIEKYFEGDIIVEEGDVGRSGFVMLGGTAEVLSPVNMGHVFSPGRQPRVVEINAGCFFGEFTMLFGFRRQRTVRAKSPVVLGKLERDDFFSITRHHAMTSRAFKQDCVRSCRCFECLSDEQIAQVVDCLEEHTFSLGDVVVKQGGLDRDIYIVMSGKCEASICTGEDDEQVHRRYSVGDRFGELSFQSRQPRQATVVVTSEEAVLLRLGVRRFERIFGKIKNFNDEQYLLDPRKTIADFFAPCSNDPRTAGGSTGSPEAKWFAVYRPTSREAIAKMLDRTAVGKGLNVKGKSATKNVLSGFVPFLQISLNSDKCNVPDSPKTARIRVFFQSAWGRDFAMHQMLPLVDPSMGLDIPTEPRGPGENAGIVLDTRFDDKGVFGLDVPERVLRKVYIDDQDISTPAGWETGRQSEPVFMDLNLQSLRERNPFTVETVVYQFDHSNPLNPHGLLIAYAETSVKPVVSDFDMFTVGSTGGAVKYQQLVPEQQALAAWSLDTTAEILQEGSRNGWNSQWLRALKCNSEALHPIMPMYGFGDATSCHLVSEIVQATKETGAIRHGAECFNFTFPQELDPEYLVVWEGFPGKHYAYQTEAELRQFLMTKALEGYAFPINPVWAVRDRGWFEIFAALREKHGREMAAWMPPESGIQDKIEAMHARFPDGLNSSEVPRAMAQADGEASPGDIAAGVAISGQDLTSKKAAEEAMYFPDHDRNSPARRHRRSSLTDAVVAAQQLVRRCSFLSHSPSRLSRDTAAWMPPESGIQDEMEAIHARFPDGLNSSEVPRDMAQADGEASPGGAAAGAAISGQDLISKNAAAEAMYFPDHDRNDIGARARGILARRLRRSATDAVVAARRLSLVPAWSRVD